ncbi:MAG: LysR family transcriptional regulator [Acidaminococcaceae bacterium]
MDIEIYRNFLAIINAGSVTAAAERMHITQPSLSKQLRILEGFYGGPLILLQRGRKEIILTEAGRVLYEKAKYICSLEDSAKTEIDSINEGVVGVLRLSIAYSRSPLFISRSIKKFSQLYPKVTYEIYEAIAAEQTQQLLNGLTEIGITTTKLNRPEAFDVLFSRPERMVAVFNIHSPWLDARKSLELKDLANIPLSLSGSGGTVFRRVCTESNFTPRIMSVNTTKSTTLQWAKDDIAVAIVTAEENEYFGEGLVDKRLDDKRFDIQKDIVKVKDRPLSRIAEKFIEFYREQRCSE